MRLSKKTDYALRTVLELARFYNKRLISVKELAKAQKIPENFLEQILLQLKSDRIVDSRRGKSGGYLLARNPDQLTMGQIVRLTEGNWGIERCQNGAQDDKCVNEFDCVVRDVWNEVFLQMEQALDTITIADLLTRSSRYRSPDYVI